MNFKKILAKPKDDIKEGVIINSIKKHLEQSVFPKNLFLSKLKSNEKESRKELQKYTTEYEKLAESKRNMKIVLDELDKNNSESISVLKKQME